jgi:RNA polymerase sigma-70 factor (ECF subfamily)
MNGGDASVAWGSSYEAFCERNRGAALALAWALSGDRTAAVDLVDDALAEAGRSWKKIGRYDDPDAWVRWVIACRAAARFGRRRPRSRVGAGPNVGRSRLGEAPALDAETGRFWREVRALPARQARCMALTYLEDRQPSEVARVLGCTVSTARLHLAQGRLALAGRTRPHQSRAAEEAMDLAWVDTRGRRAAAALREAVAAGTAARTLVGSARLEAAS